MSKSQFPYPEGTQFPEGVITNPTREQILAFQTDHYFPHTLEVAGVDMVEEMQRYPQDFPDGIDGQLACFIQDTGRLPISPPEIDHYSNTTEEWIEFMVANKLPVPEPFKSTLETIRQAADADATLDNLAYADKMAELELERIDQELTDLDLVNLDSLTKRQV